MGARLTFTIHRQALLADQAVGEDTDCDAQADGYLIGGAIGTAGLTANGILWRSRQDEPHLEDSCVYRQVWWARGDCTTNS